jgi:hypothetical protein
MTTILTSFFVVFGKMTFIGCCVITCIQGVIETALTKQSLVLYQLLLSIDEIESKWCQMSLKKRTKSKKMGELKGKQFFLSKCVTISVACSSRFLFTELHFQTKIAIYPTPKFQM